MTRKAMSCALLLTLLAMLVACASSKKQIEPDWEYEENSINITLKADPKLHSYDGIPHTLHLCLYQLKDPNAFNQLSGDEDGLYVLLGCKTFDPSVTSYKQQNLQPGQTLTLTMDRAQDSRYVGLVAGYYQLEKDKITRLQEIPVKVKTTMTFKKYAVVEPLNMEVELGPLQIGKVEVKQ